MKTLLNFGIDTTTNATIIPRSVFDEITTAHAIIEGMPEVSSQSISGYGMGWIRLSLEGRDVSQPHSLSPIKSTHNFQVIFHTGGIPGTFHLVEYKQIDLK